MYKNTIPNINKERYIQSIVIGELPKTNNCLMPSMPSARGIIETKIWIVNGKTLIGK